MFVAVSFKYAIKTKQFRTHHAGTALIHSPLTHVKIKTIFIWTTIMYSAKIAMHTSVKLPNPSGANENQDPNDILDDLCAVLYQNGQISSPERVDFIEDDYLCSIISIADKDALDARYFNIYMEKFLPLIHNGQIYFEILGKDNSYDDADNFHHCTSLVLFTSAYSIISPIRNLDTFCPIPLYQLPKTNDDNQSYYDTLSWQIAYQALDTLNMQCVNELFALAQMYDIHSQINQIGLALCQKIMEKTNKPVYYYLHRYYSDNFDREKDLRCPKCGGQWLLENKLHDLFDFRCDTCYLLSNFAFHPIEQAII